MSARYSRQAGYTIAKRSTNRRTVRTVERKVKFGPTTAKYLGIAILAVLGIAMLTKESNNAVTAYQQSSLRQQQSKVSQDIEDLQLEAKREQALQAITQSPAKEQMVAQGQVDYVESGQVAGVSTSAPTTSPTPVASATPTAQP